MTLHEFAWWQKTPKVEDKKFCVPWTAVLLQPAGKEYVYMIRGGSPNHRQFGHGVRSNAFAFCLELDHGAGVVDAQVHTTPPGAGEGIEFKNRQEQLTRAEREALDTLAGARVPNRPIVDFLHQLNPSVHYCVKMVGRYVKSRKADA